MTDTPRGPTTEELRARALAHESRERAEDGAARGPARVGVRPDLASAARGLGVSVPLAAHPLPRDLLRRPCLACNREQGERMCDLCQRLEEAEAAAP